MIPPLSGWNVPHDAPVDASFTVRPVPRDQVEDAVAKHALVARKRLREGRAEEEKWTRIEAIRRKDREQERMRKREAKRKAEEEQCMKESRKRQAEEEQRKREKDVRMREEEEKRKHEDHRKEVDERMRNEAEMKRDDIERRLSLEAEATRRAHESKAADEELDVTAFRGVLQNLSLATVETYWTTRLELVEAITTHLPKTGLQRASLQRDADRVLEYAKQQFEMNTSDNRENQEERERVAQLLLTELESMVESAEAFSECVLGLASAEGEISSGISDAMDKACVTAISSCCACEEFAAEKHATIQEATRVRKASKNKLTSLNRRAYAALKEVTDCIYNEAKASGAL
jgi:hypothetical protein